MTGGAVDVAVIGGGAVGAACARAAALRGLEVAIFEPGPDPAAASPASAGMLAAQIEPSDDVLVALSVRARDLYEPLAPALRETTGIDIAFWRSGIAAVAFDDEAAAALKHEVARQRQAGLRCDWLEGDEVRERWPGAAPECLGALFAPEDGAVDPQALARACLADARRLRSCTTSTGTCSRAAATRCWAAPWSAPATMPASPTRASPRFSGAPSGCCPP